MASSAAIGATDLALRAADKPLLVGRNWARESTAAFKWNQTGSYDDADDTHADGPVTYLNDDYDYLQSYPASAQATWYLIIDLGTTDAVFDCVAMLDHDVESTGGATTHQIDLATASNFAGSINVYDTAIASATTDQRLVHLSLFHTGSDPMRYTGYRYIRIRFSLAGTLQPKIGEIIIGRSRQLKHNPLEPYDDIGKQSDVKTFMSENRVVSKYVGAKGYRTLKSTLSIHEDTYKDDLETFWDDDIDSGTQPFLWIDNPTSAPRVAHWMHFPKPRFAGPIRNWTDRRFRWDCEELGGRFVSVET